MDSKNHTGWKENEIYSTTTYPYTLSISFWGKVTIHIDRSEFEVRLDEDDGSVRGIDLY